MALLNVGDVSQKVSALMDDPGQTVFDDDYVIPFINLRWDELIVDLAALGLQYSEATAVFTVPAGTLDSSVFQVPGQPLASMMSPKSVEWKPVGADDTQYLSADAVAELDDQAQGAPGLLQYTWSGGTIGLTPSAVDVVGRFRFSAMSTTLVDPDDRMVRGVGHILAYRTAELIMAIRGNPLQATYRTMGDAALDGFFSYSVMQAQSKLVNTLPSHQRFRWGGPLHLSND